MSESLSCNYPRILVLGHSDRGIDFTAVYEFLASQRGVTVILWNKQQLRKLKQQLSKINFNHYQRVLVDLPFSKVHKVGRSLRKIPGLIIYEEDACQNFIPNSRWYTKFAEFYQLLPEAQFILTGYNTAQRFAELGLATHCVPKGYDQRTLYTTQITRDLEIAFIGRTRSRVYTERLAFLETLQEQFDLALLRTSSTDEYRNTLNRIRIFVSADINLGEYMAKNFEAMACGCAVLAFRQGNGEEEALGLKDMENIALYSSIEEAAMKIQQLRSNPEHLQQIAQNGMNLVKQQFSHQHIAESLLQIARSNSPTTETVENRSWLQHILTRLHNR